MRRKLENTHDLLGIINDLHEKALMENDLDSLEFFTCVLFEIQQRFVGNIHPINYDQELGSFIRKHSQGEDYE